MKICPKCNGINPDQAEYCRFCGTMFYDSLTVECPNCGRRCSLDKQYCPNCGAKLPVINPKVQTKWRSPKSWLSNKKLLIKLGIILVVIVGLLSLAGIMKNSTYLFHASVSRKIQISYQDVNHHTILNEYYDVRNNNRNYANYFGGKSSYWHRQRNFKSTAYFYGSGRSGYNKLWKNYHGKYAARYKMEQKIQGGVKIRS